jgi:hypothetical protein
MTATIAIERFPYRDKNGDVRYTECPQCSANLDAYYDAEGRND